MVALPRGRPFRWALTASLHNKLAVVKVLPATIDNSQFAVFPRT